MANFLTFMSEVRAELKKVTWPSKDELIGSTIIVCILVCVFAVILGLMEAGFSSLISKLV